MSNKCVSCGLVNFATELSCRRCGSAFVAVASSALVNNNAINQSSQTAIQLDKTELSAKYIRRMIFGLLWSMGGVAVTLGTYISASQNPNGGRYFIAWGAVIFGVFDFFVGLSGWIKHRHEA